MFYLRYLFRELTRRFRRTVLTVLALAVGIGLVVAIAGLSRGLERAERRALSPLAGVGTDMMVTMPVATAGGQAGGPPGGGPGSPDQFQQMQQVIQENQNVLTDLSKLGKPGDRFVHDFFLPGNYLTLPEDRVEAVRQLPGVVSVTRALVMLAVHQEGTVPQIVAEFQSGGEELNIEASIQPMTPEEEAQVRACMEKARQEGRAGGFRECLPERFRSFQMRVVTPQRVIRQILNPPQTDIKSEPYTVAGVEERGGGASIIGPEQIVQGRFFSASWEGEAVLAEAYAQRKGMAVGSALELNGKRFQVVGLARPPLGGIVADVYLPLRDLQALSGKEGRVNVLLVRADSASGVPEVARAIQGSVPGVQVASAKELAERVSGSLVSAVEVGKRVGLVLAVVALGGAFLIVALLTSGSVARRVREFGVLKAIGWSRWLVVRQILGESVAQALLGGGLGAGLGLGGTALIPRFVPALTATAPSAASPSVFGLGQVAAASTRIPLEPRVSGGVLLAAVGLALVAGLVAGGLGASRAARLRPSEALRDIG